MSYGRTPITLTARMCIDSLTFLLLSLSATEVDKLMKMGREDDTTVVNVSVAIWFTKDFADVEEDIQG